MKDIFKRYIGVIILGLIIVSIIIICALVPVLRNNVFQNWIMGIKFILFVLITGLYLRSLSSELSLTSTFERLASDCEKDFGNLTIAMNENNKVDQSALSDEEKNRFIDFQKKNADSRVEAKKSSVEAKKFSSENKRNCFELTVKYVGVVAILWLGLGSWVS